MVLLSTTEKSGSVFIRTDQLDGETDWKLRKAINYTQKVQPSSRLINVEGVIVANPPNNLIYDFKGYFESHELQSISMVKGSRKSSVIPPISPGKEEDLLRKSSMMSENGMSS